MVPQHMAENTYMNLRSMNLEAVLWEPLKKQTNRLKKVQAIYGILVRLSLQEPRLSERVGQLYFTQRERARLLPRDTFIMMETKS